MNGWLKLAKTIRQNEIMNEALLKLSKQHNNPTYVHLVVSKAIEDCKNA